MFELASEPRKKWDSRLGRPQPISLVPIDRGPLSERRIFTIGSCFALELRHEFMRLGFDTFPKYYDLVLEHDTVSVGRLPHRDNVNHYNIVSILQEFEHIVGPTPVYSHDYFWNLASDPAFRPVKRFASAVVLSNLSEQRKKFDVNWQDPFRKDTYAEGFEALASAHDAVSAKIEEGARRADLFIITLGMTEVWLDRKSNLAVCNAYGGKVDEGLCEFVDLSVGETIEKTARLVEAIRRINPASDIVLTLSPVPLQRTAKEESVVTANAVSKAKQRVAIDEVRRQFENVFYFPGYELCQDDAAFQEDGRHVTPELVEHIVETFIRWYDDSPGEVASESKRTAQTAAP